MTADDAQALVARCLVEPGFLPAAVGAVEENGPMLTTTRTNLPCQFEALILFRGFITAIKHNGLRKIAPLTLRLLHAFNLEVAFFAAMAPAYQEARRNGPLPLPELFSNFEFQLAEYLPRVGAEMRGVLEAMLRHERNILHTSTNPVEDPRGSGPRLAPGARVEHFPLDVLALCAELSREPLGPPPAADRRDQFLFYRRDGAATRAFEIDAISATVVSGLDGRRGFSEVCDSAAEALGFVTPELIATLLEDASSHNMILIGSDEGVA